MLHTRLIRWTTVCALLLPAVLGQVRPVQKSADATQKIEIPGSRFAVWIKPADWKVESAKNGLVVLEHSLGNRVQLTAAAGPDTSVAVKRAALAELKMIDSAIDEVNSETWSLNGKELLVAEFTFAAEHVPQVLVAGYFGSPAGALRAELRSTKHIPTSGKSAFRQLLTGLDFGDQ